jgi:hypothetical protein
MAGAFWFANATARPFGPQAAEDNQAIENGQLASWRTISVQFDQEHIIEQQQSSRAYVGQVSMSCYSSASMHLLGTLPIGEVVLIECPDHCAENKV